MRPKAFVPAVVLFACLVSVSELHALANRVFVSARSGNDANTCDNILAPCQTFAGAVTKLNSGGEAIVLDSGGYGAVTITQALTIEAPPGVVAFIHPSSGDAVAINAGSSATVVLRGLVLNGGSANGVSVLSVGTLSLENCAISGFAADGVHMTATGILDMKNTDVKNCGFAVELNNSSGTIRVSLDHCHLDGNNSGYVANTTGTGVSTTTATNCTANHNGGSGWLNFGPGVNVLNLEFCSGSENGVDGVFGNSSNGSSVTRYSTCVFSNNGSFGIERSSAATFESRTNNTATGNGSAPTSGVIGTFPPI